MVDSEYLETLLVAVPKYVARSPRIKSLSLSLSFDGCLCADHSHWICTCTAIVFCSNLVRDWKEKYERLTTMVVPRSSSYVS